MRWLHEGDANTKFFHLHENHRRCKNHITSLQVEGAILTYEEDKVAAAFDYFDTILGTRHCRSCALDFQALGLPQLDLLDLGRPFTEAEIWEVIRDLPLDKAPSPDRFTSRFYRSSWLIIKRDIIRDFDALSSMDC